MMMMIILKVRSFIMTLANSKYSVVDEKNQTCIEIIKKHAFKENNLTETK
jgi:hypothetical protein